MGEATSLPCRPPDVTPFLQIYQNQIQIPRGLDVLVGDPQAISLPMQNDARHLWFGVNWSGPTGGVPVVLNCRGRPEASLALGAIEEIKAGPAVPTGPPAYEVRYTSGTGTGSRRQDVSVVRYQAGKIQVLWHHVADAVFAGMGEGHYEDKFTWSYGQTNRSIVVSGIRENTIDGPKPRVDRKQLSVTSYCWRGQRQRQRFFMCDPK
jgi:hypothetical protein